MLSDAKPRWQYGGLPASYDVTGGGDWQITTPSATPCPDGTEKKTTRPPMLKMELRYYIRTEATMKSSSTHITAEERECLHTGHIEGGSMRSTALRLW